MKYVLSAVCFLWAAQLCQASDYFMMDEGAFLARIAMEEGYSADEEHQAFNVWENLSFALDAFVSGAWPTSEPEDSEQVAAITSPKQAYIAGIQQGKDEIEALLNNTDVIVQGPAQPVDLRQQSLDEVDFTPYDKSFEATKKHLQDPNWAGHWDVSGHDFTLVQVAQLLGVINSMPSKGRTIDLSPNRDYQFSVYLAALVIKFLSINPSTQIVLDGLRLPEDFHLLSGVSLVHFKNTTTYPDPHALQKMDDIIKAMKIVIE